MARPALPPVTRRTFLIGSAATAAAALLAACGGSSAVTDTPKPVVTTAPVVATTAPAGASPSTSVASGAAASAVALGSGQINGMTWEQILAKAKGGTANWFLYGGSQTTNDYLDKYVIPQMQQQFGVTVQADARHGYGRGGQ